MAQFKVGDKVRIKFTDKTITGDVIHVPNELELEVRCNEFPDSFSVLAATVEPVPHTLTITATLTTDTIPTELLKQLSAAGFLITIKAI